MQVGSGDHSHPFHEERGNSSPCLGSYRLLLAVMVVFAHSAWSLGAVIHAAPGVTAVLCFFVVSGYLITLTIELNYTRDVLRYAINRFLRIYPTFWISMLVAVAAILSIGATNVAPSFYVDWTWSNILRCVLIAPAYGDNATWGPIPVGWTLQIEVCFYVLMGLLYFAIGRLPSARRHTAVILLCAGALTLHVAIIATTRLWWSNGVLFIPFFAAGTLAAVISRTYAHRNVRFMGAALLIVALGLCLHILARWSSGRYIEAGLLTVDPTAAGNGHPLGTPIAFVVLCGLFFVLLSTTTSSRFASLRRIDTALGELTYPLYTLHFTAQPASWLLAFRLSRRLYRHRTTDAIDRRSHCRDASDRLAPIGNTHENTCAISS